MKVGIVIGRMGGVDGVALETEKWIEVLEQKLKHEVFVLTGKIEGKVKNATILEELDFFHPNTIKEQDDAFYKQNKMSGQRLKERLESEASYIEKKILHWIINNRIDCVLAENASALPCHLTMGMALESIAANTSTKVITHDHDFSWERGDRYATKYKEIEEIKKRCFPIPLEKVKHAVINLHAQKTLAQKGIQSLVVPNVMDFNMSYGKIDSYNKNMVQDLGFKKDDILLFQITRIVRRKGIEAAIELVQHLNNPKVHLVITGRSTDDHKEEYTYELKALAKKLKVSKQIHFLGDRFDNFRGENRRGEKVYSLSDGYAHACACTYFSTYEGFGNAFVECVLARKPIFVNNYKPVYWPDIGAKGFDCVMIENLKWTEKLISEVESVIYDANRASQIADRNFKLGKKYFSYEVLARLLRKLF